MDRCADVRGRPCDGVGEAKRMRRGAVWGEHRADRLVGGAHRLGVLGVEPAVVVVVESEPPVLVEVLEEPGALRCLSDRVRGHRSPYPG